MEGGQASAALSSFWGARVYWHAGKCWTLPTNICYGDQVCARFKTNPLYCASLHSPRRNLDKCWHPKCIRAGPTHPDHGGWGDFCWAAWQTTSKREGMIIDTATLPLYCRGITSYSHMGDEARNDNRNLLDKLMALLSGLPWLEVLESGWKAAHKLIQARSYWGIYEVLEYESTLELKGWGWKRATFNKREKVRYLQDNVIVFQDQTWGDGEILVNYRCSPGKPVDRYRSSHKTHILMALRLG